MRFVLRKVDGDQLERPCEEILAAAEAQQRANALRENEELFENLIQAYINLERTALDFSLRHAANPMFGFAEKYEVTSSFNLAMGTLLFAARAYVDKTRTWLSRTYKDNNAYLELFDRARREEHAASFGFKFLEALRNYAQHVGTPVSGFSVKLLSGNDGGWISCAIGIARKDVDGLEEFRHVQAEITKMPQVIQLQPLVREYLASFSSVQNKLRRALDDELRTYRRAIFHVFIETGTMKDELVVHELDDSGNVSEEFALNIGTLHRINRLSTANKSLRVEGLRVRTHV